MLDPRVALCKFLLNLPGRYYLWARWLESRTDELNNLAMRILGVRWSQVSGDVIEELQERGLLRTYREVPHARA